VFETTFYTLQKLPRGNTNPRQAAQPYFLSQKLSCHSHLSQHCHNKKYRKINRLNQLVTRHRSSLEVILTLGNVFLYIYASVLPWQHEPRAEPWAPEGVPHFVYGHCPTNAGYHGSPYCQGTLALATSHCWLFLWHKLYLFYWETEQREERHQTWGVNLLSVRVKRLVRGFYPFPKGKP